MISRIIRSIIAVFSTYTAIPTPRVKWDGDATRLAIGFFPLAGAAVGLAVWGWSVLCEAFGIGNTLFAAVSVSLPVLITGGIHLDGFCDTVDALSSRTVRARMLEILKDPNAGAFAVIYCAVYLLISFGLFTEARGSIAVISFGYVLSRSLSALCAMTMPSARGTGMLAQFTKNAQKRAVLVLCAIFTALACAGMLIFDPRGGLIAIALVLAVTVFYRHMAMKRFGGATGDTAGFFLQLAELALLTGAVIGGII